MTPRRPLAIPVLRRLRVAKYMLLSDAKSLIGDPRLEQPVLFSGAGQIRIGLGVTFGWRLSPNFFDGYGYVEARNLEATVQIADDVIFNNSVTIICERSSISIGARCVVGPHVSIIDSDGHGFGGDDLLSAAPEIAPVEIGSSVLLGMGATVLKGVTIGDGSVIGAGSLVASSVPAGVVAAGVPARPLREVRQKAD